ncbi:RNA polymerase factor sigma-54 [Comamonas sp. NLF-1-9]|uniref:RNA polymerase factor sigma-54 n=1 Tax=Comamonas sp. NLF-1-9 TaxID=2853163 RepID=UPI001C493B5C|nr:RNA polymerase factor sigma-54 [Comamonas sp. NLF-1-9]QXL85295.1 RNA polymerase factor sigma-54 [Comamonas sp. NLF-1-9]
MGSMQLTTTTRQVQTLSPRLQRAVQLLQMSSLDFAQMVREKIDENPFLEEEEDSDTAPPAAAETASDTESYPEGEAGDDRDIWLSERGPGKQQSDDEHASAIDLAASRTTLAMHLHGQLNLMALGERDLCLARAIIESLDDDGYLRIALDEVIDRRQLSPAPQPAELMIALRLVQSLEPAGIAARSVGECLALQCPRIADSGTRALALRIVEDHLEALAARDVAGLAKALRQPAARVQEAIAAVRRLNPRPGWSVGNARIDYIVPDVTVRRVRGRWCAQLNPAVVPRVRLNRVYAELFQRHRRSGHEPLVDHLQEARWTVRNIEQRFATILDVAQAIIRKQELFLEYGAMAMKPLVLREIADEIGVHESTVSRVTNNKYMATPLGVFELKHFFSRPMISASGKACSATAIRELIGDIIAGESPAQPLSDGDITRQLAAQGLLVARRTVTKYRQLLRIEPVARRRRCA